jgi:hypothetical protein
MCFSGSCALNEKLVHPGGFLHQNQTNDSSNEVPCVPLNWVQKDPTGSDLSLTNYTKLSLKPLLPHWLQCALTELGLNTHDLA